MRVAMGDSRAFLVSSVALTALGASSSCDVGVSLADKACSSYEEMDGFTTFLESVAVSVAWPWLCFNR